MPVQDSIKVRSIGFNIQNKRVAMIEKASAETIRRSLYNTARRAQRMLNRTSRTWKVHKPSAQFKISIKQTSSGWNVKIYNTSLVWAYLDQGAERKVGMEKFFEPKTEELVFDSQEGFGKAKYFASAAGKMSANGVMWMYDPIEARLWTEEIVLIFENQFQADLQEKIFLLFRR